MKSKRTKPVVMITGAARDLGKEIVRTFSKAGYLIFATARVIPRKQQTGVLWHELDVSDAEQCKNAISAGFAAYGQIDVLINNASSYIGGNIVDMSTDDIERELAVTLRAPILMSKLYVEKAQSHKSGKVIFISSVAGLSGESDCEQYSVYAAAKAGLIRFAECLSEDIQRLGMQTHVVVPCYMLPESNQAKLITKKAIGYNAMCQHLLNIAQCHDNMSITKSILRPARISNR